MTSWTLITCLFFTFLIMHFSEAASPVFLQAISSALATMPLTGFPMSLTAGLTGAKLAVGGKLLYYLGMFGRGGGPKTPAVQSQFGATQAGFPPNQFQSFGTGFSTGQGLPGNPIPPQTQFSAPRLPPDPSVLIQSLAAQGINPMQLMQALGDAGIDPAQLMQVISEGGGGPGNRAGQAAPAFPPQRFPLPGGGRPSLSQIGVAVGGGRPPFSMNAMGGGGPAFPPMGQTPGGMPQDFSNSLPPFPEEDTEDEPTAGGAEEDIDSFFSFLKDMDDNKCISRLICDIGADPDFLGEFTRNIDTIINSLEVPAESGAHEYIRIMENGRKEGNCGEKFQECDDEAYEIVKSVAPSVGVPGISSTGGR